MPFTHNHFIRHRAFLYHFTDPANLGMLRQRRSLLSAARWVYLANKHREQIPDPEAFLRTPRPEAVELDIGQGYIVTLNDQRPLLNRNNFASLRGEFGDFVRYLNDLVFFWPGTEARPRPKGNLAASFAQRYANFGCIRIPTADAWPPTDERRVLFCQCNSGAPHVRDRLERGRHIFMRHTDAALSFKKVAEVVCEHQLDLPPTAEWQNTGNANWGPLFV